MQVESKSPNFSQLEQKIRAQRMLNLHSPHSNLSHLIHRWNCLKLVAVSMMMMIAVTSVVSRLITLETFNKWQCARWFSVKNLWSFESLWTSTLFSCSTRIHLLNQPNLHSNCVLECPQNCTITHNHRQTCAAIKIYEACG